MLSHDPAPYTILVGIDYSEQSVLALSEALTLASHRARSHLHFVQVTARGASNQAGAGGSIPGGAGLHDEQLRLLSEELHGYVTRILGTPAEHAARDAERRVPWSTHVRVGPPAQAIAGLAVELEANLVVVGTHSRKGLARFLLGSVAEGVVRHSPCPVLVVRPLELASPGDTSQDRSALAAQGAAAPALPS